MGQRAIAPKHYSYRQEPAYEEPAYYPQPVIDREPVYRGREPVVYREPVIYREPVVYHQHRAMRAVPEQVNHIRYRPIRSTQQSVINQRHDPYIGGAHVAEPGGLGD